MSLKILVNDSTDSTRKNAAAAIAEQLEELGIATEIVAAPFSVASDKNEYTDKLAAGEYDIALVGINVGRDGDMRDVMARDGKANYGNYYDAELYELACAMMKPETRPHTAALRQSFSLPSRRGCRSYRCISGWTA